MGKYYLISKISSIPYGEYKGSAVRLSKQCPAKVDEVIVGCKEAPAQVKKITTFRNKQGNIIERAFDYSGEPLKNRLYSLVFDKICKSSVALRSSEVKEYSLPRKLLRKFLKRLKGKKIDLWTPVKIETHHIKTAKRGEKIHSLTRITDIAKGQIPIHTIIEFPHKKSGDVCLTPKKFLQFRVNPLDNSVFQDSFVVQNVKIPQNDSYLGFRILGIEASKVPLTKRFINQRGLADMNVKAGVCSYKEKKDGHTISARFAPWNGVIEYNKLFRHKSKAALVDTARHEVEHAWQYYLNARNGCGTDPWEISIYKKFGDICKSPRLRAEADKYSEAIGNYVSVEKDPEKYFNSLIEVLARKAGIIAKTKYNIEGFGIRDSFPNIPRELL